MAEFLNSMGMMLFMLWVLGINHKVQIDIRQRFCLARFQLQDALLKLKRLSDEVIIVNTCNRVEIYFYSKEFVKASYVFDALGWDKKYMDLFFIYKDKECVKHLLEVICGFDSLIIGEEQIVYQIKEAKEVANIVIGKNPILDRLFELSLRCSKEFRTSSRLNEHPISIASVVGNAIKNRGIKEIAIIGLGNIGFLFCNYFKNSNMVKILLIGRKNERIDEFVKSQPDKFVYSDKKEAINNVECLICSTSAPHTVIHKEDIPKGKSVIIFDLAAPRDVDFEVYHLPNVEVIDIDTVHKMDTINKEYRISKMKENYDIIDEYTEKFMNWLEFRQYNCLIENIKKHANYLSKRQLKYLKEVETQKLIEIEMLLNKIANIYIDRAVDVLKEEQKRGSGEICSNLIKRIFLS